MFQTKLGFDIICHGVAEKSFFGEIEFQTKLGFDIICHTKTQSANDLYIDVSN